MVTLTENQEKERGALLARVLYLKRDKKYSKLWETDAWKTEWGTKTNLGLFRTVQSIIDGKLE